MNGKNRTISLIHPEQKTGNKNLSDFSKLLYNIYGRQAISDRDKNNGLTAKTIVDMIKKFSEDDGKISNPNRIAVLNNYDNNNEFESDETKKEEFLNIMLILVNKDELLNLGNEIYKNNLKFDNTGNYQFFRNLLNLKDNKDLCTYEQFVNYLNIFNFNCMNVFNVANEVEWTVINDFYKNWDLDVNINKNKLGDYNNWSHLCSICHIVDMNNKIMCQQAWKNILTLFKNKNLNKKQINLLFNLEGDEPLLGISLNNEGTISTLIYFFDILKTDIYEDFIDIIGDKNIVNKIIGNIKNNNDIDKFIGMSNYLKMLKDYKNSWLKNNLNCNQLLNILEEHELWKNKSITINDNIINEILDLVKPDEYNNLFKTGINDINIQSHMIQYIELI